MIDQANQGPLPVPQAFKSSCTCLAVGKSHTQALQAEQ